MFRCIRSNIVRAFGREHSVSFDLLNFIRAMSPAKKARTAEGTTMAMIAASERPLDEEVSGKSGEEGTNSIETEMISSIPYSDGWSWWPPPPMWG